MLQFDNVYIGFGKDLEGDSLVKALSFSLSSGEVLAIVGESGSGKSLSVLAMNGLLPGARILGGSITLRLADGNAYQLVDLPSDQRRILLQKHTGYIFQEPMSSLNPLMRCGKQVEERLLHIEDAAERKRLVMHWFEKVRLNEPERIYVSYPHELSGGQRQRVMIAMALIHGPDLIIADEPTTALDASVQLEVISLLHELVKEQGAAMIFISHDLHVVQQIADQILVMFHGRTMEYGSASQIFEDPHSAYTRALLKVKPSFSSKGHYLPTLRDLTDTCDGEMVNKPFLPIPWKDTKSAETKLLELNNITVSYHSSGKSSRILDHISLSLKAGQALGIIGESGSGKSTLVKAVIRLLKAEGSQELRGIPYQNWGKDFTRQVQMIFQDPYASLNPNQKIGDCIAEPMLVNGICKTQKEALERAKHLLELCGLNPQDGSKYPHQFSGGQRQRICIARALAVEPEILLCDESVSALDVSVQAQILNLLKELQLNKGLSILFITHDLNVAAWFCDEIAVLYKGEVVETGTVSQVIHHPRSPYTAKLLRASGIV